MKELNERMTRALLSYFKSNEQLNIDSSNFSSELHNPYFSFEMSQIHDFNERKSKKLHLVLLKTNEEFTVSNSKTKVPGPDRENSLKVCSLISDSYNSRLPAVVQTIFKKSQLETEKKCIPKSKGNSNIEIVRGSKFDISKAKRLDLNKKSKEKTMDKVNIKIEDEVNDTILSSINKILTINRCSHMEQHIIRPTNLELDRSKSRYDTLYHTPNCLVSNPISNPNELAVSSHQDYEYLNMLNTNTLSRDNNSTLPGINSPNTNSKNKYIPIDQITESYYRIIKDELEDIKL